MTPYASSIIWIDVPLPFGHYSPQPGFAFTRSQVAGLRICYDPGSDSFEFGDGLYGAYDPSHTVFVRLVVDPRIYDPSTNHYTLDYVMADSQYYPLPVSPPGYPLPFYLRYYVDPTNGYAWIQYSPTDPPGSLVFEYRWPSVPNVGVQFPWGM